VANKIPIYESQQNILTPPAQMPFAGADSGSIAAGAALAGAKQAQVEIAQDTESLNKGVKSLAGIGLYYKAANDAAAATGAVTDTMVKLGQAELDAPDFETYQQVSKKIVADAKGGLPTIEANTAFDRHIEHYVTRAAVVVQKKFFTQGIHDKIGELIGNLDVLSKMVNDSPTPEQAEALVAAANDAVDSQVGSRLIAADVGTKLKKEFSSKLWYGLVERRAQLDPMQTRQEMMDGVYNDTLDAGQITHLLDRTEQRINVDNRVAKMAAREEDMMAKKGQSDLLVYYQGRLLDADKYKLNPSEILAEAAASGLDQKGLNQLQGRANSQVDRQVRFYQGLIQRQLGLPEDIAGMMAKKQHLAGVDLNALREYNESAATLRAEVLKGSPADIVGETILNNIKAKQTNPLSTLTQSIDQLRVDGFQGDRMNVQALDQYLLIVQAGVTQGQISAAQGMLIQSQVNNLKSFLGRKQRATPKPGAAPGQSSGTSSGAATQGFTGGGSSQ